MEIIAKMVCEKVEECRFPEEPTGEKWAEAITLRAVTGESEENKSFSVFTPSAFLGMTITNKNAWGAFAEGGEYYVRFEKA